MLELQELEEKEKREADLEGKVFKQDFIYLEVFYPNVSLCYSYM